MKIYDIESLFRDVNQEDLYDFFEPTFINDLSIPRKTFNVGVEQEMRIDEVCNSVYKDVDKVDILLNINDIDNPLNIMMGDVITYPPAVSKTEFRVNTSEIKEARRGLLNINKRTKKDSNREKFIENNFSLPPTYLPEPTKPVRIEGDQIIIN